MNARYRAGRAGVGLIIVAFCLTDEPVQPKMIAVDERNRFAGNLVKASAEEVLARG